MFRSGKTRPAHAQSSGSERLLCIRSLAGYIIGTLESRFRKRQPDLVATRAELVDRGVNVSEPFHFGPEGQTRGLDPGRADYNSFVSFSDPDGNGWLIQEVKKRAPGR
jgi:hypothetical protein